MTEWTTENIIGEQGGFGQVCISRKEVRLSKRLNHPNVVEIIDENLYSEPFFYIMNLYDYSMVNIIEGLKSDYERLRAIFNYIFDGVEYLHSQGVLHRDLKPGNILMNSNDELVIADFGLGVQVTSNSERHTATGTYMGTQFYMAPEQRNDSKNVDKRADIYSLACIIFQSIA